MRGIEFVSKPHAEDVASAALTFEHIEPQTILPGERALSPGLRRVIAHGRPVWYVTDGGLLAPVSARLNGLEAEANTVRFRMTETGAAIYRVGQHTLRARPQRVQAEATDGTATRDVEYTAPAVTEATEAAIIQRGSVADLRVEHRVSPGEIKEIVWLDAAPAGIESARWWVMTYHWESETLTPTLVGGAILWRDAAQRVILRWPAPLVTDALGRELRANYRIVARLPNVVALIVNATDLRAAVYPVAVDPTTTTGSSANTASRARVSAIISATNREYESCYTLITLPDMTGNTVTAAELQLRAGAVESALSCDIYGCKNGTTWDATSNLTTMNSVRSGMGTVLQSAFTGWSANAWNYFDVLGDSTKGVAKIYTDNANPGACTFSVRWPASGRTMNTTLINMRVGDQDIPNEVNMANHQDATNYPRVEIDYTTGGGGGNGSWFFMF